MLKRVTVTNFKNFSKKVIFDLSSPANYEFNEEIVSQGCITKGIVYGINGSGKSNLALAVFDIILHMTDKQKLLEKYINYLNLSSNKPCADFEYVFTFDGKELIYQYGKKDRETLTYEKLSIDGNEVLNYDFGQQAGYTNLKGAENLQLTSKINSSSNKLSRVKYLSSNAILQDDPVNKVFGKFIDFVNRMLMFYSLDTNGYQGLQEGVDSYTQGIVREHKEKDFQEFLKKSDIDYELVSMNINGVDDLFCKFSNKIVPFSLIASTGTKSLALFYYWYIKISKASLVFIDEYDAFYHFELSQELVKQLKQLSKTQVFLSTHNTDLLSNDILRPDAYFIIEDNEIRSLDKCTDKELRRAHNIQKMYKAGSFNG